MYAVHHSLAVSYITELVTTIAAQTSRPRMRTADTTNYVQPRIWTKFREQAFSHAAPLHGTRYQMNFDKHLLSTVLSTTSRLFFRIDTELYNHQNADTSAVNTTVQYITCKLTRWHTMELLQFINYSTKVWYAQFIQHSTVKLLYLL